MRCALILCALAGCTSATSTPSSEPVLTGDACAAYGSDESDCTANPDCHFLGTGCACAPSDPTCNCPPGSCASIDNGSDSGSGSSAGSGSAMAGCACSDGGVCVAQSGQPITCIVPTPGSSDPCTRIPNLTCHDDPTIAGLCVCGDALH